MSPRASHSRHSFIRVVVRAVEVYATDDDVETARDDDGDVESARRARDEDEDDARWDEDAWWRHDERQFFVYEKHIG